MKRKEACHSSSSNNHHSTSACYLQSYQSSVGFLKKRRMAISEIELVEKVFLRIVLAETDDQLQSSLNGFLAPVLLKLSSRNDQVKNKILELLTHINRRLKSRTKIQLPLISLLNQYKDEKLPSTVQNFTIIYIKMGYQRADKKDQISLIPKMFSCLNRKFEKHQDIFLQSLLLNLNQYPYPDNLEERRNLFCFVKDKVILRNTLDFFADFLLMPYNMELKMEDPSVLPPPSLSKAIYSRLKTDPPMTKEQIEDAKLGILKFLTSEILSPKEIISHLIIASSDGKHNISDKAEHMIKKFSSLDLWECAEVMDKLLKIYQGSLQKPGNLHDALHSANVRIPSSKRLKLKIFPYFLKSKLVVDLNPPLCLQVIFEGLFGDDVISKIKHYSLEFIHHLSHYCSQKTLSFLGPLFYQALCRVALDKKEDTKLRSLAFAGFSKLSKRLPGIIKKDIGLIQKLFILLDEEESETKLSIQDALSSISTAFAGITGPNIKMIEILILSNVEKENPSLRLAAVQFANNVFPTTHILSRYACLLCTADSQDSVREEALRGLSKSKSSKSVDTERFYADYFEACDFLYSEVTERKMKSNINGLVFPALIYEKLLSYLKACLYANCNITESDLLDKTYLSKLKKYVQTILKEEHLKDLSQHPFGRHISLIRESLAPSGSYALHSVAITDLLELVLAVPGQLSPHFLQNMNWLQTFLYSTKEEIRESTARLLSIILCTLPMQEISSHINQSINHLDSKVFEEHHGNILLVGNLLSRCAFLQRQSNCMKMEVENDESLKDTMYIHVEKVIGILCLKLRNANVLISTASCAAIGEISKYYVLPVPDKCTENGGVSKEQVVEQLSTLLQNAPESKVKEKAALALGYLCVGDANFPHRTKIINNLIGTAKIRQPELHFTIGEAFSCIGAGALSKVAQNDFISDSGLPTVDNKQHMIDVLQEIIKKCVCSPVVYMRQAGVIWLLCIVKFSSEHPGLQEQIKEVQTAFINLLSDSDDVIQDVASRGLGLVYDLVQTENKDELVSTLVDRLMSGKRPKQTVNEETEVFKPGVLGSTPDGENLSTYKELCSLATSMNRPDLMYKFMNLANHHAMWNSRKGAAFGFLSIAALAGDQLKPYLSEIIPKLYRYQFDPNPSIQRAMSNIWSALVPDGKKTVDKYTKEILKDILSNITSNTWRTRESCCLALNDLIRSSSPEDIVEQLPLLWNVAFKVMDDIKESVRKAATILAKTLSRLSARICDVNQSKLGQKAVSEVLPVLLEVGLSSRVAEVKELCLQTLVQVTKNAGALLKPHIPKFVTALLESLSGLEPQYLNTLSLQLSQSQEAQEKLDIIRLSATKSSPMMESINFCVQYVDETVLPELTPRLTDLLKTGIGIGTKVGCSSLVIRLTLHCKQQLTPFAGKLLGALLNGLNDRNVTIKKAYANAIGHLIGFAKEASIVKLLERLTKSYFDHEDESVHMSCAWCINAMSKYSSDTFYHYLTSVMPLVFVAMQEDLDKKETVDKTLSELWNEIWNNNTAGNVSAIKLYLTEIYVLLEPLFSHQSWVLRKKAGIAVMAIANALASSLSQPHLQKFINLLLNALQGRTWNGKEYLLKALSTIYIKCHSTILENIDESIPSIQTVVDTFLKECKKENLSYKACALECSTNVIEEWKINVFDKYKPTIDGLLNYETDDDDDESMGSRNEDMVIIAFDVLGKVWPHDKKAQETHFHYVTDIFLNYLHKSSWKTQLSLLKASIAFVDRTFWDDALVEWKNGEEKGMAEVFIDSFVGQVCLCVETSSFSSIKLHGVKLVKEFYHKASEYEIMIRHLSKFESRILNLINQLSSSTNFDITNNVLDLAKLIDSLSTCS